MGKQALNVGADIASDVIVNKNDWKDSVKNRLNEGAVNITNAGVARAKKFIQTGEGRRKTIKRTKRKIRKGKVTKKRSPPKSIKRAKPKRKTSNALTKLLQNASTYS